MNKNDKVWYACYGSNLSAERFRHYIQGGEYEGKVYGACVNTDLWETSMVRRYPGRMYFGNRSHRWHDHGVAFYDPEGEGTVIMRLYLITWEQLMHVRDWEGASDRWYGNIVPLDEEDGVPVFTLTSLRRNPGNYPGNLYMCLIKRALVEECGIPEDEAGKYLAECWEMSS